MQVIYGMFLSMITRNFDRFSADSDKVMDGLPDGLTDESDDVWTERNYCRKWTFRKLHTGILIGIFTMNLADGLTDGTDNGITFGLTDRQLMQLTYRQTCCIDCMTDRHI